MLAAAEPGPLVKVRIKWPPEPRKGEKDKDGNHLRIDGEPCYIPLERHPYDSALRGDIRHQCCDCGAEHVVTFAVFRQTGGNWFLVKRVYKTKGKGV